MPRPDGRIDAGERASNAVSAKAWNALMDERDRSFGASLSVRKGQSKPPLPFAHYLVGKNTSASTVPMWGAVKITGMAIVAGSSASDAANAQFARSPTLTVAVPSSTSMVDPVAIAQQPVKAGEFGLFAVSGIVQVKCDAGYSSSDKYLSLYAGTTVLKNTTYGQLEVLWLEGGGTDKTALARFNMQPPATNIFLCKTTAAWAKGTTATLQLWANTGTYGTEANTGSTMTAYNLYANIAAGKFCTVAAHSSGGNYVIAAECA